MAKKKKAAGEGEGGEGEGEGKKGKKKLIIMVVVIVLIGGGVAKTVLLKPKPATAAQIAAAAKLTDIKLENLCAAHNSLPAVPLPTGTQSKGSKTTPSTTTTTIADAPTPAGPVDTLDSITINLAAGHYLKVGLALQVPAGMDPTTVKTTENWEAVALKAVIDSLSGQTIDTLSAQRESDENAIGDDVCRKTDGKVLTIYFTDFVMQ